MIVAGIDPGTHENAVAQVDFDAPRPRLVHWAKWDRDTLAGFLAGLVACPCPDFALAIELVDGVAFSSARAADLIRTQRPACIAEGIAIASGTKHACLSGREWRGQWLGFPTASDRAIRIAVESVLDFAPDLDRIRADDRKHIYDACGVALASAPSFGLPPVGIPAAARGLIDAEMRAVRSRTAAKGLATKAAARRA